MIKRIELELGRGINAQVNIILTNSELKELETMTQEQHQEYLNKKALYNLKEAIENKELI